MRAKHSKNIGFTLLEVLVSLTLLSLMLISFYTLQITTLQKSQSSYYFSLATQQLHNLSQQLSSLNTTDHTLIYQQWNQQNHQLLPNGQGAISGFYPNYKLTIYWGFKSTQSCPQNKIGQSGCISLEINTQ